MTIGGSLLLIAVGAILKYAVTVHVEGLNLHTAGLILMIVGVLGLILGLYFLSGLTALSDRLAALDGRLQVGSPADGGTLVSAAIPLRP